MVPQHIRLGDLLVAVGLLTPEGYRPALRQFIGGAEP